MTAPLWMPGATRLAALQDGGSMLGRDAYVTWHTFECDYNVSALVGARSLNANGTQVTLVFHPITGDVVQLIPANRAGRGLQNKPGGVETNRQGRVNVQIEVIGRSSRPWTKDLTAAGRAGLGRIIAWLDDLGVPRTAPNGFVGPASYAASTKRPRSLTAWNGPGGYFCHADVPENDHWDHGAIDMRDLWAAAPTTTTGGFLMALTDAQQQKILDAANRVLASGTASPRLLNDSDGAQLRKDIGYVRDQLRGDLSRMSAQQVADSIPDNLAQQVVDLLAARLAPKEN